MKWSFAVKKGPAKTFVSRAIKAARELEVSTPAFGIAFPTDEAIEKAMETQIPSCSEAGEHETVTVTIEG